MKLSFVNLGAFVLLTMEGNIVVDGVLASCYASTDHDLSNLVMTPIQWYPALIGWIFGEESGLPFYVKIAKSGRWALPNDQLTNFDQ